KRPKFQVGRVGSLVGFSQRRCFSPLDSPVEPLFNPFDSRRDPFELIKDPLLVFVGEAHCSLTVAAGRNACPTTQRRRNQIAATYVTAPSQSRLRQGQRYSCRKTVSKIAMASSTCSSV